MTPDDFLLEVARFLLQAISNNEFNNQNVKKKTTLTLMKYKLKRDKTKEFNTLNNGNNGGRPLEIQPHDQTQILHDLGTYSFPRRRWKLAAPLSLGFYQNHDQNLLITNDF